jgi:adenosylcobinamide kinase/adenosylcobinamide-phosphate guanylyltransferase
MASMSRLILVTGGSRSGKSGFGQNLAESLPGARAFVATCPVIDAEMNERIRRHQEERSGRGWITIEEPLDLPSALDRARRQPVVLVDCLTLWINNAMYAAEQQGAEVTETDIARRARAVIDAARAHGGTIIFITNEVGMGLVPESPLGRRFRDLAGRSNQIFGSACDEVHLAVCGQILQIKPNPSLTI